jgi:hypothetical protein
MVESRWLRLDREMREIKRVDTQASSKASRLEKEKEQ